MQAVPIVVGTEIGGRAANPKRIIAAVAKVGIHDRGVVIEFVSESVGHFKAVIFSAGTLVVVELYRRAPIPAVAIRIITIADAAAAIVKDERLSGRAARIRRSRMDRGE